MSELKPILPPVLIVGVTQKDIDRGTPDNPYCCPVAWAIRRHLSTSGRRISREGVAVHKEQVVLTLNGKKRRAIYQARGDATLFIRNYDLSKRLGFTVPPIRLTFYLQEVTYGTPDQPPD